MLSLSDSRFLKVLKVLLFWNSRSDELLESVRLRQAGLDGTTLFRADALMVLLVEASSPFRVRFALVRSLPDRRCGILHEKTVAPCLLLLRLSPFGSFALPLTSARILSSIGASDIAFPVATSSSY